MQIDVLLMSALSVLPPKKEKRNIITNLPIYNSILYLDEIMAD